MKLSPRLETADASARRAGMSTATAAVIRHVPMAKAFSPRTIYMVRESLASTTAKGATEYHAAVVEAQLQETPVMQGALTGAGGGDSGGRASYTVTMECPVEELFEGDSKGFEGAIHLHDATGQLYMLALCEGNHCAQKQKGREKGNGVLVVTKKVVKDDGTCSWQTIRHMKVPSSAMFQDYSGINIQQGTGRVLISSQDYSGINIQQGTGRVLISSQEESQLWVGRMSLCSDGRFDPMKSELEGGVVFDFPRNDACEIIYCNLEASFVGVTWVTDHLIVAVSDRMKGGGAQPSRCQAKDQSIHVFALPESWEKSLQATLP
ncbi:hypothetical protein JKP88DRAFT_353620 [Tribonema minus]|uniref:Uncharacterized protein n=1 Tax=Tribonema minus TaxID=303371 RepID=A0A835Z6R4_9STRA|nr:hypothetical protein JKP88DRAFT_353620 [Tribonema minus]